MRGVNRAILIGNCGHDPEIRTTSSGTLIAKVSLATTRTRKNRQGVATDETQWHRLTFFGKLAEIVEEYVGKGDRLYVEGRIEYDQTEDETGHTRYWTDIIVENLTMLGSVKQEEGAVPASDVADDRMPF